MDSRKDADEAQLTQRLRKYEAEAVSIRVDDGDPSMELFSPFGPMLSRVRVPAELVQRINDYADPICSTDQGMEFGLPESVVSAGEEHSLARITGQLIARYLEQIERVTVDTISFEHFWIVSQFEGTPSPVHFHSGDISGVLYLKVPEIADEQSEELKTYISGKWAGYINFLSGGKQQYSKTLVSFKPEVGDFYIFPGWLLHGAEPFRGRGERRSMAFNAFVS